MTPIERRASASLAFIYALRMLGLFLVLPVFALEAANYPGGSDAAMVGLAMGVYGLTQGLLQLPLGMASDRLGRKQVMVCGLLVFALGSFAAAAADTLQGLVIGRALQGAGAVSAVVTALLADLTRDAVRTKAMALVGASIGLTFALSLVIAPVLVGLGGLPILFVLTGCLALVGIGVTVWLVPAPPQRTGSVSVARGRLSDVLRHGPTMRLNVGVFVLHAVLLAMWVGVPALLVQAGLAAAQHWWLYLPAIGLSFGVMSATLFPMERRGYLRAAYLGAIGLTALVQVGLTLVTPSPQLAAMAVLLFLFFCGSNVLEAAQPSMASRMAPPGARGTALGVYNTLQSLGFFTGGAAGGWLAKNVGLQGLFAACAALMLLWLVVAWPMRAPARSASPEEILATEAQGT